MTIGLDVIAYAVYNISEKSYGAENNTTLIGLMRNIGTVKGILTADTGR